MEGDERADARFGPRTRVVTALQQLQEPWSDGNTTSRVRLRDVGVEQSLQVFLCTSTDHIYQTPKILFIYRPHGTSFAKRGLSTYDNQVAELCRSTDRPRFVMSAACTIALVARRQLRGHLAIYSYLRLRVNVPILDNSDLWRQLSSVSK